MLETDDIDISLGGGSAPQLLVLETDDIETSPDGSAPDSLGVRGEGSEEVPNCVVRGFAS